MSATLGGLIKDYRLQKNISQLEVVFALGWKEPSRLSRIEQGRVGNPSREFIDKLITVLKLSEEEKNELLYTGNYLPTEEEISKIREKVDPLIRKWPYPIIVYDFSWRVVHINKISSYIYQFDQIMGEKISESLPNILEVIFHPNNHYLKGMKLTQLHNFLMTIILQFKSIQRTRTKGTWYINLIRKMMNDDLFRRLWKESDKVQEEEKPIDIYERLSVIHNGNAIEPLNFHFFSLPLLKDRRFYIEYYIPADMETMRYFKK